MGNFAMSTYPAIPHRYFQLLNTAIPLSNRHELVEFLQSIADSFLVELSWPDTSWKIFLIS